MEMSLLMSAAYGWFAGLLVIMIVVCALFGLIMFIALRPVKKDVPEDTIAAKLQRREAEIAGRLINKQNDKQTTDELIGKLREIRSAEKIVNELNPEEEKSAPEKPAQKKTSAKAATAPVKETPKAEAKAQPEKQDAPEAKEQAETPENK